MSLREVILAAADLKREAVVVPEWVDAETGQPVTVYVSTMSGLTRMQWNAVAFVDGKAIQSMVRSRLLVFCLTDEAGATLFAPDDVAALEAKNDDVLDRLFDAAKRINGMGAEEAERAEKNSPPGETTTSGTSSPSPSTEA